MRFVTQDIRNLLVASVLSVLVLIGWTIVQERYFPAPKPPITVASASVPNAAGVATPVVPGVAPAITAAATIATRTQALGANPRIAIQTPRLLGSINLKGARIDDLVLPTYRETVDPASPPVRLLSPGGTADAYFGQFGWTGAGAPPADAVWTASAATLTPAAPVTLRWTSPAGVVFEQIIAVDRDFLFTIAQRVRNDSAAPIAVRPFGLVSRKGEGTEKNAYNLHVGPIGVMDGTLRDTEVNYDKLLSEGPKKYSSAGGWLGITEKYWLAALIPDQKSRVEARFAAAADQFQTDYLAPPLVVAPGASAGTTARFFAGAKEVNLLDRYMNTLAIPHFDLAVSWGWFIVIAQPIFRLLDWLFKLSGNFGVAIIGLTIVVRAALFPIANKQFESMAKMRIVAPKMKAIQEKYKDDKAKAQQEIMALYKTERVNPLAGCLPLVLQIPIFYALYKTLLVSIEMRHQPFILWIKDLSAPDHLTPLNLFGAIDWTPPAFIAIGVFPMILGVTMYLQQRLNPTPLDPVQKQVFAIMPWMFMFIMAPFAAGLQLYWITNNVLSILQQAYMLRKYPMPATPPEPITVKATTAKPAPAKPGGSKALK